MHVHNKARLPTTLESSYTPTLSRATPTCLPITPPYMLLHGCGRGGPLSCLRLAAAAAAAAAPETNNKSRTMFMNKSSWTTFTNELANRSSQTFVFLLFFSCVFLFFFAFIFFTHFFVYFWFYFSFVFVFVCFLLCFYFLVLCSLWFLCQDKCRRSDWPSAQYFCQKLILAIKCKSQLDALHSSGLRNRRDP